MDALNEMVEVAPGCTVTALVWFVWRAMPPLPNTAVTAAERLKYGERTNWRYIAKQRLQAQSTVETVPSAQ